MNLPPAPKPQIELFRVEKQATIDGVEMGVLENGVPYLTESGLKGDSKRISRPSLKPPEFHLIQRKQRSRITKIAHLQRSNSTY
jgi:hypothetical protein